MTTGSIYTPGAISPTVTVRAMHTIVYIEDNAGDIRMMAEAISERKAPIELLTFQNGLDAMVYLVSPPVPPHSILIDQRLPGMQGTDVLAFIREQPIFHHVPVFIFGETEQEHHVGATTVVKGNNIDDWLDLADRLAQ